MAQLDSASEKVLIARILKTEENQLKTNQNNKNMRRIFNFIKMRI